MGKEIECLKAVTNMMRLTLLVQNTGLEELHVIGCCDFCYTVFTQYGSGVEKMIRSVRQRGVCNSQKNSEAIPAIASFVAQFKDSLQFVKEHDMFGEDTQGALHAFFLATTDRFSSSLIAPLASLSVRHHRLTVRYVDAMKQLEQHYGQEVELPSEIKNELALYAQPEHREAIAKATQQCACVYDEVKALNQFLEREGCDGVRERLNRHIVQFIITSLITALQGLGVPPRTVRAERTRHS